MFSCFAKPRSLREPRPNGGPVRIFKAADRSIKEGSAGVPRTPADSKPFLRIEECELHYFVREIKYDP